MDRIYQNEGFDKLMEKYNFDSPIKVTLVIEEEEDPPEPVFLKNLLVLNKTKFPNSNIGSYSSEVYKRTDSNIDIAKNKMPTTEKNSNNTSIIEENNRSFSVIQTVPLEGHQKKNQNFQWQLLDVVADNLIHITKCYYHNFINNKKQTVEYEKLIFEYLTFKHHFFNLSYSTTISILLPQENDNLFFDYFIYRVIKIANRSSWYQISYEMLDHLIREMLIWTKKKKNNLDIKLGSHNHESGGMDGSSSALTISKRLNHSKQITNKPFDNGPITNQSTQGINKQSDTVPKTHLPIQVMNISPNIKHKTNYPTQELPRPDNISPRTNYPMQDIDNPNGNSHIKNNKAAKRTKKRHNNCSDTYHSQPEIISPYFSKRTNHSNQGTSSPNNSDRRINNPTQGRSRFPYNGSRMNHSTETITSIYNNEPKTNNFSMNTNTSKILLSTGPPNHEITISVDKEIFDNINQQNTNQLNNDASQCHVNKSTTSINRIEKTDHSSYYPYSNSNSMPHVNENNFHYKKNNCSAKTFKSPVDGLYQDDSTKAEKELLNTDTSRSSISRDSGFGSPICGNFRSDQTIEMPTNEEYETPVISYVTSMNPNAVQFSVGFCKVCGATTNNMCIGCYQTYYCSFVCQTKDWKNHMYLCSG